MAELPEHLAKTLAELEAQKESLRSRLESVDSAIVGIQGLKSAPAAPAPDPADAQAVPPVATASDANPNFILVNDVPEEMPQREFVGEVRRSQVQRVATQPQTGNPNSAPPPQKSPVTTGKALARQTPQPAPDRRKPSQLNIYVNRNAEWAAQQFVPPHSPRAVFRHKTGHRCPKCGSQDTRLSLTRGLTDCLMFLFDYSIARCRNCDTRFRIWRSRSEEDDGEHELEGHPSAE